jgi:hypothetical protein
MRRSTARVLLVLALAALAWLAAVAASIWLLPG